jgi:hypothetical protein
MSITKKIPIVIGIKPNAVTTFTNKTISGLDNTLTNIPNSALVNSIISINGSPISLGGNVTISGTGVGVDTNTTYSIKATAITGGASLDLDAGGTGTGTDSVNFVSGGNVSISRVDANTIRISGAEAAALTNIPNSALTNSSITINGTAVALGGSIIIAGGGSGDLTAAGIATLTNKTISGSSNTITNIPNSALVNPSISINGTPVALGTNFTVSGLGNVTTDGVQDLSNKSLGAPIIQDAKLTGTLRVGIAAGGNPGTNGQVLKSTGTGVVWANEIQTTASALTIGSGLNGSGGATSFDGSNGFTLSVNTDIIAPIPEWTLGADAGSDYYTFTGPGFIGAVEDPVLYLTRGQTYKFTNPLGAHPFRIQSTSNSGGTVYITGITASAGATGNPTNGITQGTLTWNVSFDAPNILYYICTAHPNMVGTIYILDYVVGGGGGSGSFNGPSGASDNAIVRFEGTTGALAQNSLVTISDTGVITAPSVASVIPFYHTDTLAFPSAGLSNGAIAVAAGDNTVHFASSSTWFQLAKASDVTVQSRASFGTGNFSLNSGTSTNKDVTAYKSYLLLKLQTSHAAWVRVYTSTAARAADASRLIDVDPLPGSGVIAEIITTAASTQVLTPAVIGFNDEASPVPTVYLAITNRSGSNQGAFFVNLTALKLEA